MNQIAVNNAEGLDHDRIACGDVSLLVTTAAIVIGFFLLAVGAMPFMQHGRADYSVPVRALVVESRTLPPARPLHRIWPRHQFAYRYLYQGELYLGSAYRTTGGAAEAVRRYSIGATIYAWVDPGQPQRAVVETGHRGRDVVFMILGLVSLIAGLVRFILLVARDHGGRSIHPETPPSATRNFI